MKKLLLLLVLALPLAAQDPRKEYLYLVRPATQNLDPKIIGQHVAYLQKLTEDGTIILAGRTQEELATTFGIVIFRAKDDATALEIMNADPAVANKQFKAELHPYAVAFRGR